MAEEPNWEEGMLQALARSVVYPPTPNLRAAVLARIAVPPRAPSSPNAWRYAAGAAASFLIALALVLVVSRGARDAVAEFLGIAVEGEQVEQLPTAPAGTTPTPFPTTVLLERLAERVSRDEAIRRGGFEPVLPSGRGEPLAFYAIRSGNELVIADYGTFQIWEFELAEIFIGKGIPGGGEVVSQVTVNGAPGYWIRGAERIVSIREADGSVRAGTQRTVSEPALVWAAGGLYRRIEGNFSLDEALAIAATMP